MRLTAKLTAIVFMAVAVLMCATGMVTIRQQLVSFQKGREATAEQLRQKVAEQLTKAWKEGGRSGVDKAMSSMHIELHLTQLRFFQLGVPPDHPDSPSVPRSQLDHVVHGEIASVVMRDGAGNDWLKTYLPILTDDAPVGLELSDSLAHLTEQRRHTIRSTLLTLAALGMICLGVVFIVGIRLVGRPLEQLIEKTKAIGRGDFSHPLAIKGNDELSQLGTALNQMSDQLSAQKQAIESETASRLATLSQLRHADRLKTVGRLAAGMAHELGTPLNVVAGRAGLIASGRLSEEEIRESAGTIKGEADRITRIIRQLLDFARLTTLQRHKTDLRTVTSRTAELLRTLADSHNVRIATPSENDPLVADVDEGQVQQVLTNIMMNAIQSIAGEGTVTISLGTRTTFPPGHDSGSELAYVFIEIRDDGAGISAEQCEHIFEPFFTTKDVGDGTGLGLSIAYGIVQEHGGWIDVESEPGQGSRFIVYLPQESNRD